MTRLLIEKAEIEARLLKSNPESARFLYHGTSFPEHLPMLRPSFSQTMHHAEQGAFVFATPEFLNAALYTMKTHDSGPSDELVGLQRVNEF
jgi:hypothetical protein